MLKRKATNFMKNWINTKDKKCLVVQGARQTGKTYTVERFAEENYEELVEINFKQMPSAMEIFSGDLTVDAMVMGMRFRFPEKKIIPGKTLIFGGKLGVVTVLMSFVLGPVIEFVGNLLQKVIEIDE